MCEYMNEYNYYTYNTTFYIYYTTIYIVSFILDFLCFHRKREFTSNTRFSQCVSAVPSSPWSSSSAPSSSGQLK